MKKRIILMMTAAISICASLYAQKATFGFQGGINMNKAIAKDMAGEKIANDFVPGYHVGINVEIPIFHGFYFQPGLQYITKNIKREGKSYTYDLNISYVEMPINFILKPKVGSGNLIAGFGAAIAYGIKGKSKYDRIGSTQYDRENKVIFKNSWDPSDPDQQGNEYIRPFDLGIGLLFGFQFKNNMYFQFNGQYGLLNTSAKIDESETYLEQGVIKNINVGLSVGYRF